MSTQPADSARKSSFHNLNRQASLYSLAAAAASVSMLALAQPAQGEVVITRKTIPLTYEVTAIDINNDGVNDFEFINYFSFGSADLTERGAFPERGAVMVGRGYATPLMPGANIGPSARFSPSSTYVGIERGFHVGYPNEQLRGPWGGNPQNRYLGVRFIIDGELHYGWVRLTVTTQPAGSWGATITAYAYETVANKKILAGTNKSADDDEAQVQTEKPGGASLGMLALGAGGLSLWRHEETSTAK